jgi:hypothetical protein
MLGFKSGYNIIQASNMRIQPIFIVELDGTRSPFPLSSGIVDVVGI